MRLRLENNITWSSLSWFAWYKIKSISLKWKKIFQKEKHGPFFCKYAAIIFHVICHFICHFIITGSCHSKGNAIPLFLLPLKTIIIIIIIIIINNFSFFNFLPCFLEVLDNKWRKIASLYITLDQGNGHMVLVFGFFQQFFLFCFSKFNSLKFF